ncbi:hypothetical protein DFJ58DRAFT_824138 [Suillus subalutaceus]|uniref:uncharacterized protein n=1 Tax=Suillus subalutaceus TaxID=48586 RepID=UPI001B863BB7|nr:uncharacterized protein DFJ58DRAFT_824138 [Suillus subalutaceus]KAG1831207.1 hypothetical protein DFJ58DRAFT_824138 [Suillus subalutaceus]
MLRVLTTICALPQNILLCYPKLPNSHPNAICASSMTSTPPPLLLPNFQATSSVSSTRCLWAGRYPRQTTPPSTSSATRYKVQHRRPIRAS